MSCKGSEQEPWIQTPQTEYLSKVLQINPQSLSQESEVQDRILQLKFLPGAIKICFAVETQPLMSRWPCEFPFPAQTPLLKREGKGCSSDLEAVPTLLRMVLIYWEGWSGTGTGRAAQDLMQSASV